MLTGILKATRAHYAALQHRASQDRECLQYFVTNCEGRNTLTNGSIMVKTKTPSGYIDTGKRKREMTKLHRRLWAMYPEATLIEVEYPGSSTSYAKIR